MHPRPFALALAAAFLITALGLSSLLHADESPLRPDHPREYLVQKGDTLWDIAARFLREPWLWPEIWHINPAIDDPHLIYPGDRVVLVYEGGEPRITVERERRTVKLSPQVREEALDRPVATIPMSVIRPFLERPRVVARQEFEASPYIVTGSDERLLTAAGGQIYVRGLHNEATRDYLLYRLGDPYVDPDADNEEDAILGYEAIQVGEARKAADGDPATFNVTRSRQEVRPADRLQPAEDDIYADFFPRAPDFSIDGAIISVFGGVTQIGRHRVVVLNKGERDGLAEGHVLGVFQAGMEVDDRIRGERVRLPEQRAGTLMVFRVFERVSYGLIVNANRPMHLHDRVRNP